VPLSTDRGLTCLAVRIDTRHPAYMTGQRRFASVMGSRWGPRLVLLCWALIILWIALLARNDAGASHTVTVIALCAAAVSAIGWFLLARRARCGTPRR
jgi:hypothetical protein